MEKWPKNYDLHIIKRKKKTHYSKNAAKLKIEPDLITGAFSRLLYTNPAGFIENFGLFRLFVYLLGFIEINID